ncbi:MAG: Mov34/MPN/PAD-1 family protein [Actinomycetota bacterium]|nr:Mov34/MPN/PAD-1 family protein [Actinomycetota bacterium]
MRFEPGLARTLVAFLRQLGPVERGGVLLGRRDEGTTQVSLAVFPPQLAHASSHCAFAVNAIEILHNASGTIEADDVLRPVEKVVGWVHTHPKIGLYLSNTDVTTFAAWTQLDPAAVAVVVDPYQSGDDVDRIGWWSAPDRDAPVEPGPRTADRQPIREVEPAPEDTLSWTGSALLAEAVEREGNGGCWEIVSTTGVHSIFPTPQVEAVTQPEAAAEPGVMAGPDVTPDSQVADESDMTPGHDLTSEPDVASEPDIGVESKVVDEEAG